MKTIYIILISLSIVLQSNAQETAPESEFKYIQPIAVENAKIEKNEPVSEPVEEEQVEQTSSQEEIKIDSDNDGVFDETDECPDTPANIKVNEKGCEKDSDEDGVVDSIDQCPDTPKGFSVNENGCPETATLKINFAHNSYQIPDEHVEDLERFTKFLQENVLYQVIIYGHTDNTGTEVYNSSLSQNRADSVKNALIENGIDRIRVTAVGKSELEPISDNETKEGRAQNRRIEVELLK